MNLPGKMILFAVILKMDKKDSMKLLIKPKLEEWMSLIIAHKPLTSVIQ